MPKARKKSDEFDRYLDAVHEHNARQMDAKRRIEERREQQRLEREMDDWEHMI